MVTCSIYQSLVAPGTRVAWSLVETPCGGTARGPGTNPRTWFRPCQVLCGSMGVASSSVQDAEGLGFFGAGGGTGMHCMAAHGRAWPRMAHASERSGSRGARKSSLEKLVVSAALHGTSNGRQSTLSTNGDASGGQARTSHKGRSEKTRVSGFFSKNPRRQR